MRFPSSLKYALTTAPSYPNGMKINSIYSTKNSFDKKARLSDIGRDKLHLILATDARHSAKTSAPSQTEAAARASARLRRSQRSPRCLALATR